MVARASIPGGCLYLPTQSARGPSAECHLQSAQMDRLVQALANERQSLERSGRAVVYPDRIRNLRIHRRQKLAQRKASERGCGGQVRLFTEKSEWISGRSGILHRVP